MFLCTKNLMFKKLYGLSASETVLLCRIFELKSGEVTEGWRKVHNEDLHNLYSQNIIRVIK
jgi:hypothetical protein